MPFFVGLDIGGTKIAGAIFGEQGDLLVQKIHPTPTHDYAELLHVCVDLVQDLENAAHHAGPEKALVGLSCTGVVEARKGTVWSVNVPCLKDRTFRDDLARELGREIRLANDCKCVALAEAINGAGQGFSTVFGLILGTGVGGGFVRDGRILEGVNGFSGEIGHLPLPWPDPEDGDLLSCNCGKMGCIDVTASGRGLSHLYLQRTGQIRTAAAIADQAAAGDGPSMAVLDRFYEIVTKATVVIINTFDPEVIVVGGGLANLPDLYTEIPKRWSRYTLLPPQTQIRPARHLEACGERGAAFLWRMTGV